MVRSASSPIGETRLVLASKTADRGPGRTTCIYEAFPASLPCEFAATSSGGPTPASVVSPGVGETGATGDASSLYAPSMAGAGPGGAAAPAVQASY